MNQKRITRRLEQNENRLMKLLMLERGMIKSGFAVDHDLFRGLVDEIRTERSDILSKGRVIISNI